MRRFVVVGATATASPNFLLADLPGSSGRLDVLLRCLRAALLVSHGLRRDTIVYLVLLGGSEAPRVLRFDGAGARYVRPDERSLATTVKKVLAEPSGGAGFVVMRPGIARADAGLDAVLAELPPLPAFVLELGAPDIREQVLDPRDCVFYVGDHLGLEPGLRARLLECGARPLGLGPVSVHADDAIAIVCNELDRRAASLPSQ